MKARKLRIHAPAIAYFDKVRRCGSFREAARSLNVASSAVNRQILKLEEELGAPLFERLPSGLRLTPAGEVFTRHVIAVMQDTERVSSELDALQGLRSGHVEIATVEGVTVDLLPAVIERMRALYPNVSVGVSSLGSTAIAAQISSGNADLGLAFALQRDNDLHQLVRGHFHLGAIMLPDHPLARHRRLSFATCAAHPLILAKEALSIAHLLRPAMNQSPQWGRAVVETSSVELAKKLALRGVGIAFQTRIGIEDELRRGQLVHVPLVHNQPVLSDLGLYTRSQRSLPVAVDAFARMLVDEIARREQQEQEQEQAQSSGHTLIL
ncbi:MAG: LysR family transcriptional regulator [Saccharospirillaceae bacterium]|nr:LysR family transcriptional regulator [Saccharospirillaceae bacterium]MCD8532298.1 LysR family transcriptional regulator [Saccharospirillaceae bacterium]